MSEHITQRIHKVLSEVKGFDAVGLDSSDKEHLYIRYNGKPYAVKIVAMEEQKITQSHRDRYLNTDETSLQDFVNLGQVKYWV